MTDDSTLTNALETIFNKMAEKEESIGVKRIEEPKDSIIQKLSKFPTTSSQRTKLTPLLLLPSMHNQQQQQQNQRHSQHVVGPEMNGFWEQRRITKLLRMRERFLNREIRQRNEVITKELDAFDDELLPTWQQLKACAAAERKANTAVLEDIATQQRREYLLSEKLIKELRVIHKQLRTEYECGFDEIVCYFRFNIRVSEQVSNARVLSELRREAFETEKASAENKRRKNELARIINQQKSNFDVNEADDRLYIQSLETAVYTILFDAFKAHRKVLANIESEAHALRIDREQRQIQMQYATNNCISEEAAARERLQQYGKRIFDVMRSSAADSLKKALQIQLVRERREECEKNVVKEEETKYRNTIVQDYLLTIEELSLLFAQSQAAAEELGRRTIIRQRHRLLSDLWSEKEKLIMFDTDNESCMAVRAQFEDSLQYTAIMEERFERSELALQKQAEKTFILAKLKSRANLANSSYRVRDEIKMMAEKELEKIINLLRDAQNRFSFFWYEALRRRWIDQESCEMAKLFTKHGIVLAISARAFVSYKQSKVDTALTSSDGNYTLFLKRTTAPWFFGTEGTSFLEGASLYQSNQTTTPLTTVTTVRCYFEIMNPHEGDVIVYTLPCMMDDEKLERIETSNSSESTTLTLNYTGHIQQLFEGVKFRNKLHYGHLRVMKRVIRAKIANVACIVYVQVLPPIFKVPEQLFTTNVLLPLASYQPPPREYKRVRVIMKIETTEGENKITFPLPATYYLHPKFGIQLNGRHMMKVLSQTSCMIDVEFDNNVTVPIKSLLAAIQINRRDGAFPLEPVMLDVILVGRDDTVTQVKHFLDMDNVNLDTPRLRMHSMDVAARVSVFEKTDIFKYKSHLCIIPFSLFSRAYLMFPVEQTKYTGGILSVDVLNDENSYVQLLIHRIDDDKEDFSFDVNEGRLLCYDSIKNNPIDIAAVYGNRTNQLTVRFSPETEFPTDYINALLHSISFSYKIGAPNVGKEKIYNVALKLDVRDNLEIDPVAVCVRLHVYPSVVDVKSTSFSYREGSGWKTFPTMSVKPAGYMFHAEARLELQMVSGFEADDSDELTLMDSTPDPKLEGLSWLFSGGIPIASWMRINKTSITVSFSSVRHFWLRSSVEHSYSPKNFNEPETPASDINIVLRSIAYQSTSQDATETTKLFSMVIDDGVSGPTNIIFEITIECVDDPTNIILKRDEIVYRQATREAQEGVPLMPGVVLEDVDSDNFNGGYFTVEYTSGPMESGDNIIVLNLDQQEALVHQPQNTSSYSLLSTFLLPGKKKDLMESRSMPNSVTPYLYVICEERPRTSLCVKDGRLFYQGELIGTVSLKRNASKDVSSLTFNFRSANKFVSFPVAQYAMRCIAYKNTNFKMVFGPRVYTIRLNCSGLKSTIESVAKITIQGQPATLVVPPFSVSVKFEGDKPRQILKAATVCIPPNLKQGKGYLKAHITNIDDPNDEIILDETVSNVKFKDKTVIVGRDVVGTTAAHAGQLVCANTLTSSSSFYLSFINKITTETLESVVHALYYNNKSKELTDLRTRVVEIECCLSGIPQEACLSTVTVDVSRKDAPYTITARRRVISYMKGTSPAPLLRDVSVTENGKGKMFSAGWGVEIAIINGLSFKEYIVLQTTSLISIRTEESPIAIIDNSGTTIATLTKKPSNFIDGAVAYSKSLLLIFQCDLKPEALKSLLSVLAYVNHERLDQGSSKTLTVSLVRPKNTTSPLTSANSSTLMRMDIGIHIIESALDTTLTPTTLFFPYSDMSKEERDLGVAVASRLRVVLPENPGVVSMGMSIPSSTHHAATLLWRPPIDNSVLQIVQEGTKIYYWCGSRKQQLLFATMVDRSTGVFFNLEPDVSDDIMAQTLLRGIFIVKKPVENDVEKEDTVRSVMDNAAGLVSIPVEITITCNLGTNTETIAVQM